MQVTYKYYYFIVIRADIRTCKVSYDMLLILSGLSGSSETVHDAKLHIRWRLLRGRYMKTLESLLVSGLRKRLSLSNSRIKEEAEFIPHQVSTLPHRGLGWPPAVAVVSWKDPAS
ncbi:hypothetical protein Tco_0461626 [Tanacetum coccineum]